MASNRNGKVVSIFSVKGGVGKTTMAINLAGIYYRCKKKVLIIDADFSSGGVSCWLDIRNKKDIFMMIDSITNNRYVGIQDYVTSYNNGIDVLASPRDPRSAMKIDAKYIPLVLSFAKKEYDVVIVDTTHVINDINLMILDHSYMTLFMITNDLVDLKNAKSMVSIFKSTDKKNYLVCLNNSRDTGRDYLSLFDIRNIIKCNIDYTISSRFYIKNIDKYVLNGEILTLNKGINRFHAMDIERIKDIGLNLIDERHSEGDSGV